ncbi:MAG: TPM domain-containing protein [Flavobacteriales bacterium]|nr:TPM domain-containing protein [Flavobacteriales bacterium]
MANDFFTSEQQEQIVSAIKTAELNTSGEIRVHIEKRCKEAVLDRASNVFGSLKMHKTELRNGVLFYLATEDHRFAILGDGGINAVVPDDFWESTKEKMQVHFKNGDFAQGLSEGVLSAGEQLKAHFPYQSDDVNELDDEISFGNE